MKNYFEYCIIWWDGSEEKECRGVTYGENYSEAVENLIKFYGEEDIISLKVEFWDCEGCLEITKGALDDIKSKNSF